MEKVKNVEDIEIELEKNVNIKFTDNMKFVSSEFGITRNVPLNSIFKESKFSEKKEAETSAESKTKEEPAEKNEESTEKKEGSSQKKEDKPENKEEDKKEEEKKNENSEADNGNTSTDK